MHNLKKLKQAFVTQRNNAFYRGIKFLLTFEEWLKEWEDSGHLHERGKFKDQYVMSRLGDKGPYAVGNVAIVKAVVNSTEAAVRPRSDQAKINMKSAFRTRVRSDEHQKNLTASLQNKPPVTKETGLKISKALKGRKRKPFTAEHLQRMAEATKRSIEAKKALGTYMNPGRFRKIEIDKKGQPQC